MNHAFPESTSASYIKASDFQDREVSVIYEGWDYKANEDRIKDGKVVKSWKDCLDYILKYSYPKLATDKAGEPILGEDGKQLDNRNYKAEYPHGYSIVYHFDKGDLESGSSPLFNAFKRLQPKVGESLTIKRTGQLLETKWSVCRTADLMRQDVPERDVDEFGATTTLPF
jgi:hypothetical protein